MARIEAGALNGRIREIRDIRGSCLFWWTSKDIFENRRYAPAQEVQVGRGRGAERRGALAALGEGTSWSPVPAPAHACGSDKVGQGAYCATRSAVRDRKSRSHPPGRGLESRIKSARPSAASAIISLGWPAFAHPQARGLGVAEEGWRVWPGNLGLRGATQNGGARPPGRCSTPPRRAGSRRPALLGPIVGNAAGHRWCRAPNPAEAGCACKSWPGQGVEGVRRTPRRGVPTNNTLLALGGGGRVWLLGSGVVQRGLR